MPEEERSQRHSLVQCARMSATEAVSEVVSKVVDASVKVTTAVAKPSVSKLNQAIPKCTNLVQDAKHDSRWTLQLRGHGHTLDLEKESTFNPAEKLNAEKGKRQLELPESLYGAAIMVVLNRPASNTRRGLCRLLFPVFFSLFLTSAIQITFAIFLHLSVTSVAGDLHGTCDCSDALLRMLALMAFISFIVKDVIETFTMHRWLYLFRGSKDHEMLKFISLAYPVNASHSAASLEDGGEDEASNGTDQHTRPGDESEVKMKRKLCRPLTGITKWERAAFYLCVLLPKLGIAAAVAEAGAGAVLRSGNNFDLVLNALAATFIIEFDEWAYGMLIPSALRNLCEQTDSAINMHDDEAVPVEVCGFKVCTFPKRVYEIGETLYPVFMVSVVIGSAFVADKTWCRDVGDDAAGACQNKEPSFDEILGQVLANLTGRDA